MIAHFARRAASAILLLLIAAGPQPGRAADDWGHKLPNTPTQFIFGYGSLIDTASRDATAGKPTPAIPVRVSAAFGYVRAWVDRCRCGFTALGLRRPHPGESAATINGVIYPADGTDMSAFDAREQGYRRVFVPPSMIEGVSWERLPETGTIWVYVPVGPGGQPGVGLPVASAAYPLLQSYIDLVLRGGLEYGSDFAREIIATTRDWSTFWLNDRALPRRPWVFNKDYRTIDHLLSQTEPAADDMENRLFPEPFAARNLVPQSARR
ncbi:MAG: gamma-glutamylcyclotransferase family protein [Acetobacteraceae bacterium]